MLLLVSTPGNHYANNYLNMFGSRVSALSDHLLRVLLDFWDCIGTQEVVLRGPGLGALPNLFTTQLL